SSAAEVRRPLLQERRQPFLHVLGRREEAEVIGFEQQSLIQRHLQPLVHRLQGEAHRQGAHREDTPQRAFRGRQEVRRRNHLVHQADAVGFVGVDHVAGEDQAEGVTLADQPRQSLRAAIPRGDAELDLWLAELRGIARDPQVTGHGELAAAAQRVAVFDLEEESLVAHGGEWYNENAEGGTRNAEQAGQPLRRSVPRSAFRLPRYVAPMPVQAIAWSPSGAVRIVDQRALPEAKIERDLESGEAVAEAIRTLQLRGAPLIGIAAAMGLVAGTRELRAAPRERFLARVDELVRLLGATRPTAVNLRWALDRMARVARGTPGTWGGAAVWERLQAEATAIWEEDRAMCRRIGEA